ncbi:MAG TPA: DUF397 domain-containing protein [Trebonia sp.]|nr:DUF397 domain-containing protein [Trebonia sp.]
MVEPAEVSPGWRKSSYSHNGGADCVEVGVLPWRKSTYSHNGGGDCVEAAHFPGTVLVRDTKDNGTGPVLRVTASDWSRFTGGLR